MAVPSLRVRISAPPKAISERTRALARRAWSLGPDELARLPARVPLELVMGPVVEGEQQRLTDGLAGAGIDATVDAASTTYTACPAHPRLLDSDVCPRCDGRACAACVRLGPQIACARCRTSTRRWTTFRRVRIGILLVVLIGVAGATLRDRRRLASWSSAVEVVVHPIAGEDSTEVAAYLAQLDAGALEPVATFLDAQARRYGREVVPAAVTLTLGAPLDELPPAIPDDAGALDAIQWSLRFRAWAALKVWRHDLRPADVRLFLVFREAVPGRAIEHSTGLEKGRIGAVTLFASPQAEPFNAVVLAHELLHTLGATDKYGEGGQPIPPHGLAEPDRIPTYPQAKAEVMGGAIALSPTSAVLPEGLDACVVGPQTAREIGWIGE